jgi:dihydrofolate reductase
VMGRKNFESIPDKFRPLSGRTNFVVTHQKDYPSQGIQVVHSIGDAIRDAKEKGEQECFIIGGGEIFKQAMPRCDKIYLTRIHRDFEGDVFFPEINKDEWKEILRQDFKADEKNPYSFSFMEFEKIK